MVKIVTIHQPNYLPYIGFFNKIKQSHVFIILDTVVFSKNSFTNRNKIRTPTGWMYLTIPIERKFYQKPIKDVNLPINRKWMKEHWKSILFNYNRSKYFKEYKSFFEEIYQSSIDKLSEFNIKIIEFLFDAFKIKVKSIKASDIGVDNNLRSTDLIIELLKNVGADIYLSGKSGINYLDLKKFEENGIKVFFQKFEHPIYKQQFDGFVPNLSAIDLLFNVGEESYKLI